MDDDFQLLEINKHINEMNNICKGNSEDEEIVFKMPVGKPYLFGPEK